MKTWTYRVLVASLTAGMAAAQSSGNFSATAFDPTCMINSSDGSFRGAGAGCSVTTLPGAPAGTSATQCNMMSANISTSNGSGVTLVVRPSLVTGLYTDTNLSSKNQQSSGLTSATADIGIQVCVAVDGTAGNVLPSPCVIYDQRFQQLSTNLFSQISTCATPTNTTGTVNCTLDLLQSTLSAHSFDFVVPVGQGTHTVTSSWSVFGTTSATGGTVGACAGPGVITVTQTKVFNNSGLLTY